MSTAKQEEEEESYTIPISILFIREEKKTINKHFYLYSSGISISPMK